ncbi:MAG: DUF3179 domain-containing protein [Pseudomonadota bacterium]
MTQFRRPARSLAAAPPVTRRAALLGLGAGALGVSASSAQDKDEPLSLDAAVRGLFSRNPLKQAASRARIEAHDGADLAASLIFSLRYARWHSNWLETQLRRITGDPAPRGWFEWMLWQEAHPEIDAHPSYIAFKRDMLLSIDKNFELFLREEHLTAPSARIRFEEVTWGGVRKDAIPSLDDPALISAAEAAYLGEGDLVFGVAINGDARAYPLRIMGWHEMFNDVVGGAPVALAYCTLCGAGFLFETQIEGRSEPFIFGSSGFLYRSNKLMFDRQTHTLWNQYTGEPALGPLAGAQIALKRRPVTIAPWAAWRAAHPATRVLSLETGHVRDYGEGVVYRDYFASDDLMFPALSDQTALGQKAFVFGVATTGAAKAWPLDAFEGGAVINDQVGGLSLVLIGDAAGRTIRAYDRGARQFAEREDGVLIDESGAPWRRTEDALIGPSGAAAARVPGLLSYWFAWNGYIQGNSEVYSK